MERESIDQGAIIYAGTPLGSAPPAPHIGHSNHLCDMAGRGQVTLTHMKALVRDPKFICKKCGRVANNADNLCEPVAL